LFGSRDSRFLPRTADFRVDTIFAGLLPSAGKTLAWKAAFNCAERLAAFVALLLLTPLLAIVAVAVAALSGRSPLIAHARVGRYGQRIWVLKLRTMWPAGRSGPRQRGAALMERVDATYVPASKRELDERVTSAFAAFCRRHSIDELPQLWQVVTGHMSLVGPRPMTGGELEQWYGDHGREILLVKPGLTGLWQTKGRSLLSYPQRRRLDLFLVRNWSPALYLRILLSTIPRVISGTDAK
jgi:exopolysaccharide production protein ExoY